MLRYGILRSFEMILKKGCLPACEIREAIIRTLDALSRFDIKEISRKHSLEKPYQRTAFFSNRHNCLTEFVQDDGCSQIIRHKLDDLPERKPKRSIKQNAANDLKNDLVKLLEEYKPDQLEGAIIKEVLFAIEAAEDFAGPFVDVFKEQQHLFSKLRQAYETVSWDEMDSERGCYSSVIALDVYLANEEHGSRLEQAAFLLEG